MARGRSVFTVAVSLPMLGAFAMLVAVNRLTTWKRPRSILDPTRGLDKSTDAHLEDILDEMEGQGDDLADKTVERLYDCAGVAGVQAANIMMQQHFDEKWCELCDENMKLEHEESEDEGQRVCRIIEAKQLALRPGKIQQEEIREILHNYIQQSSQEPTWIDRNLIEKGEEVFKDHGMLGFASLSCGSLPVGYATPEATKVLGFTQMLSEELARRRLIETSIFIMAVKKEGGLAFPDGEGILAIQSVRLMHAGIRYLLRKKENEHDLLECRDPMSHALLTCKWDEQEEGVPIHQVIMCATMLCFSYIAVHSFRQMGIQLSEEQERGYLHCWNVAAHVMGVNGKLLLNPGRENMKDAEALFQAIWRRYGARLSDGVKLRYGQMLAKTLLRFLESPFKAEGKSSARVSVKVTQLDLPILLPMEYLPRLLIRQFIGEYGTEVLGIKLSRFQRFLHWLVSPTLQRLPKLNRKFPRLARLKKMPLEGVAEQIFKGMLVDPKKNFPRPGRGPYLIPTGLAKRSGIRQMTTHDV